MKTKDIIKKYAKWMILFLSVVMVIGIIIYVLKKEIHILDVAGYNFISKYLISDNLTPIVKAITQLGGVIGLITIVMILSICLKNKKQKLLIWVNLGVSALLNQALKYTIQRPRPTEYRIIDESGYSFPSGHSMVSAAVYGFFIYLICKNIKNKYLKFGLIVLLGLLIILIGISRIYLGVHYTSDVLAGFLISISYLIIFTQCIKTA